jgi:uncharacterized protein (TIGR03663 family)
MGRSTGRVEWIVCGVAVLAVVARLAFLGQRIAHWDEGRVAYWILRRPENGWVYRPIVHGPFVQHTTRVVFDLLGPTDASMRLVVAVLGGLLPLSALLFRSRLEGGETVALAVVLAANPLLVYFSRFMRSDVPLAVFAFVALGFALRGLDEGRPQDLLGSGTALGLAFTTKENAVLYLLSWTGAVTLIAATVLYRRREAGRLRDTVTTWRGRIRERAVAWWQFAAGGAVLFAVVFVFFYAPRAGTDGGLGLWRALGGSASLLAVVEAATIDVVVAAVDLWIGDASANAYGPYLLHFAVVTAVGAGSTVAFALVGLADVLSTTTATVERVRTRRLVVFCGWWGLSAFVGYPYATDIKAPWLAVHVAIPLAIPAAVGIATAVREARADPPMLDDGSLDGASVLQRHARLVFAALLVVSALQVGAVAVGTSYTYPTHSANIVAQTGQPGSDLRPTVERIDRAAATDGVLYYGSLAVANEAVNDSPPAATRWYDRLPLPWYTERAGTRVTSARTPSDMPADPPPIVVVYPSEEGEIVDRLDGYQRHERAILQLGGNRTLRIGSYERRFGGQSLVYYVDESELSE